jgi:hypothetical protein
MQPFISEGTKTTHQTWVQCRAETLEPMPIGAPDFRPRMSGVLAAMGADLLARVCDDSDDEDRWPKVRA